jgi:hypothetical protein
MITLDNALEIAMELPTEELDDFIDILQKRRSQNWRKNTAEYYKLLKSDINKGNIDSIDVHQAIDELHN